MKCLLSFLTLLCFPLFISASCIRGNCKIGFGTYVFADGSKYQGRFDNGIPNGKGKMTLSNGDRYEGEFYRGKMHGEGKYFFKNGSKFIGQLRKNQFHGKGRMDYANGNVYMGNWKYSKRDGRGKLIENTGERKEGYWKEGKLVKSIKASKRKNKISTEERITSLSYKDCNNNHCHNEEGKFTYADGSYYIGHFVEGQPEGEGTCYYANGDVYIGGWKNHGPDGEGVITFTSGKKYSAVWKHGKPVKQLYEKPIIEDKKTNSRIKRADGKTDIYALIIGISSYNHMPTLKYTDDDAYHLYAFLKSPEGGALPDNHITVLIDEVATKTNIRTSMKNLFGKADQDDVVIMYYSGHGLQGRFLPIDFDGYNNSLAHREVYDLLESSQAKNKVIIADACYSGSLTSDKGTLFASLDNFYHKIDDSSGGTAILMSSKAEEQSLEYSGLRQGVFSHFLLKGLQGSADRDSNKIISVSELYNYIYNNVKEYTGNRQSPMLSGSFDKNMPIAMIR